MNGFLRKLIKKIKFKNSLTINKRYFNLSPNFKIFSYDKIIHIIQNNRFPLLFLMFRMYVIKLFQTAKLKVNSIISAINKLKHKI